MKQDNKLFACKIQWWDRHMITVTDIPITKRRKWSKGVTCPADFQNSAQQNPLRFQGLTIILLVSGLHPLGLQLWPLGPWMESLPLNLQLCPWVDPFYWRVAPVCSFIILFPAWKILVVWQPSLILSCLCPFQAKLELFLLGITFSKTLWAPHVYITLIQ